MFVVVYHNSNVFGNNSGSKFYGPFESLHEAKKCLQDVSNVHDPLFKVAPDGMTARFDPDELASANRNVDLANEIWMEIDDLNPYVNYGNRGELPIDGTDFVIVNRIMYKEQTHLWIDEQCAQQVICEVRNTRTGLTGHVMVVHEMNKGDVIESEIYTDNPELFESDHPEYDAFLVLLDDVITKRVSGDELKEIEVSCFENQLYYRAGDQDADDYVGQAWGLYTTE